MKKIFCILLAVAMMLSLAACGEKKEAEPVDPAKPNEQEQQGGETSELPTIDDYTGLWGCGRATLRIARDNAGSKAHIHWASSAAEAAEWTYDCSFDEANGALKAEDGIKKIIVWNSDGSIASEETVYSDGSAEFVIAEDGTLSWSDGKEDAGIDMSFEHSPKAEVPAAADIADGFFRLVGSYHEGESGSSLKLAQIAAEALRFAANGNFWNMDNEAFRSALLEAWNSLSGDEQKAFDGNFVGLVNYLNGCIDDWDSVKGAFEDAGVAETMSALLSDPIDWISWNGLIANVLTMGNSPS
ncbi:MAG: hypothetical protein II971_02140 [Firmicutes bacterium]|nr:hypothetical protein [Bacillota bacterium]